ncbi:hypothetical protein AYI68_g5578 [Smittium mucronatum]|uniref:Inner centromere protein ARK-binding domain-containing protein n=1 Tax=Smittium mucronatum TaxID=133383 RepID=A0A1R0GTW3_9FUNG|nr:hypothetical protein AYI68_g5578 [Smittium mucronatum]
MFELPKTNSWIEKSDFEWRNSLKRKIEYLEATTADNKSWLEMYFENFRLSSSQNNQILLLSSTFKSTRSKRYRNRCRTDVRYVFDQIVPEKKLKSTLSKSNNFGIPHSVDSHVLKDSLPSQHTSTLNTPRKTRNNSARLSYYSTLNSKLDFSKSQNHSSQKKVGTAPFLYVHQNDLPKNKVIIDIDTVPDFENTSKIDPSLKPSSLKKSFFYNISPPKSAKFERSTNNHSRIFHSSDIKERSSPNNRNRQFTPNSKSISRVYDSGSNIDHWKKDGTSKSSSKNETLPESISGHSSNARSKKNLSAKNNSKNLSNSVSTDFQDNLDVISEFPIKNSFPHNKFYSSPTTKKSIKKSKNLVSNISKEPRSSISISESPNFRFASDSERIEKSLSREQDLRELLLNSSNSSNSSLTYDDSVISRRSSNTQSNPSKPGRKKKKSDLINPFSDSNKSSKNNSPKLDNIDSPDSSQKSNDTDNKNTLQNKIPPQSNIGIMPDIKTVTPSALSYSPNATTTNNWISTDQANIVMSQGFDMINNNANKYLFNNSGLYLSPSLINQNDSINRMLNMGYNPPQFQLSDGFAQNSLSNQNLQSSVMQNSSLDSDFNAMRNLINIEQIISGRLGGVNSDILNSNSQNNFNSILNDPSFAYINNLNNTYLQSDFNTLSDPNSNMVINNSMLMAQDLQENIDKHNSQNGIIDFQNLQFQQPEIIDSNLPQSEKKDHQARIVDQESSIGACSSNNVDSEIRLRNNEMDMLDFIPLKPNEYQQQTISPEEIDSVLDVASLTEDTNSGNQGFCSGEADNTEKELVKSTQSGSESQMPLKHSTKLDSFDPMQTQNTFRLPDSIEDNLSHIRDRVMSVSSADSVESKTPFKNTPSFNETHTSIIPLGKNSPPEIISDDDDDPENEDLIYELMGDLPPNSSPQTILAAQKMAKKKLRKMRNPDIISTPPWAKTPQLIKALSDQQSVNPDLVFGAVKPIRVEEIFKNPIQKKLDGALARSQGVAALGRSRQSSGVWTGSDALNPTEIAEYNKRMGYN